MNLEPREPDQEQTYQTQISINLQRHIKLFSLIMRTISEGKRNRSHQKHPSNTAPISLSFELASSDPNPVNQQIVNCRTPQIS